MTLLDLFHLMREHIAIIIVIPLMAAAITAGICWGLLPDEYTASTSLLVLSSGSSATSESSGNVNSSDFSMSQMIASDMGQLAKSSKTKEAAAKSVGLDSLDGYEVTVTSSTTNRVMNVEVTGSNPTLAAQLANAVAKQLSDTAISAMDLEAITVVDEATTPDKPSGPKRLMYTGIVLLATFFVVLFVLVLKDAIAANFTSSEELEEVTGLPILARAPKIKGL